MLRPGILEADWRTLKTRLQNDSGELRFPVPRDKGNGGSENEILGERRKSSLQVSNLCNTGKRLGNGFSSYHANSGEM